MSHEEYRSEFEAPVRSIVSIDGLGLKVIRTVVMQDELMQFEVDREVYLAGKKLEDKNRQN